MKVVKISLAIALLIGSASAIVPSQELYAADADKGGTTIKGCQDKITDEREAILADSRKLEETKKTGNKVKIEQVTKETSKDIEERKAKIRDLYKQMYNKNPSGNNDEGKKKKKKW